VRNQTSRQMSLYLSAKLYELAAGFTDTELQAILSDDSSHLKTPAIRDAIRALMRLHQETEAPPSVTAGSPQQGVIPGDATVRTPSRQASSLSLLLQDRAIFPTVTDIASVVRMEARQKESRERYIARVTRQVELMSARERADFFDGLTSRLKRQPENFISKWSKVIKEL